MRANYPPLLGVYPDDSVPCDHAGGYSAVRSTLAIYQAATGRTADNYTYTGNHAYCPLPFGRLPNNQVPNCKPACPLPLFVTPADNTDNIHGQNIDGIVRTAVATGPKYPCQWLDRMTLFHCAISNWIAALPGFAP